MLPLLTVETEANRDLWSTNERGPFLVRGAHRAGTRDCYPALAALVNPVKFFFIEAYFFHFLSPHSPPIWAGSRAGMPVS